MKTRTPSSGAMPLVLLSLIVAVVNPAGAQAPNGAVTIVATDPWAAEAWSDPGVFTVRRSEPSSFPTRVFYQISGTASNGVDYEAIPNSIEIPPLTLGASFTVKPINDSLMESTESVVVRIIPSPMLCPTCGYIIGDRNVAEVLIEDNDRDGTNHPPFVRLDSPQDGATYATPANVMLRAYAQDYEDRFLVKVEFFEGTNSLGFGTFRPTLCPAPYCPYFDLIWSNVPPGEYSITTRATDSAGATSISDTARITVLDTTNHPPSVRVALPEPGATFITPAEIMLVADAIDPEDGKQIEIEFFEGTNSLGLATFNPTRCAYIWCGNFSLVWSNVPPGSYYLRARATDSQGAVTVSAPVQINVFGGVNIYATDPNATELSAMTAIPPDTATFTVRRSGDTSEGIVVFYEISGTASNGVDYRTLSGHVGLPAGASSAEIVVDPLDDILHEPTETVSLRLQATCPQCLFVWPPCLPPVSTNCYAIGPDHTAVAYIRDTDPPTETNQPPPIVNIVARDPFASEGKHFWRDYPEAVTWSDYWNTWGVNIGGSNTATFIVRRHTATNAALTVNYEVAGTASNGTDYRTLPGSVEIPAGKRSARVIVMPIDDSLTEGTETVVLRLSASSNYTTGVPSQAAAIIVDNDRPRPPCVMLPDGRFHVCHPATNGLCFRLEGSSDLRSWRTLCTNIVTDGALHFVDPDQSTDARFYRVLPDSGVPSED